MTEPEKREFEKLLRSMPLADLTNAKRLISAELDARQGKRKYSPEIPWRELTTR